LEPIPIRAPLFFANLQAPGVVTMGTAFATARGYARIPARRRDRRNQVSPLGAHSLMDTPFHESDTPTEPLPVPSSDSTGQLQLEQRFFDYLAALDRGETPDLDRILAELGPEKAERLKNMVLALTQKERQEGCAQPVAAGREVGDCRVIKPLGRGGTSQVWLAEQLSTGRLVALKLLNAGFLASERSRLRFQREWRAIAKLHHPNIVPLFTAGEYAGAPYYAMGRVDGRSLSDVLSVLKERSPDSITGEMLRALVNSAGEVGQPLEDLQTSESSIFRRGYVESVCRLVIRVADALDHAHEAGVIHRDVKPSNVLIARSGVPMLLDFGLAHDDDLPSITMTGEFTGTYHYVSPEQAAASRMGIDRRTDIYSLGVVLYELLTLKLPFDGATSQEILKQVLVKEPMPPRRLNPEIPRDLEMITLKAMDKDPDRRYTSAREFADDLQSFVDLKPVRARPLSRAARLRRLVRRNPAPAMAVAAVVIALAGMLGFLWWSGLQRHAMARDQVQRAAELLANERYQEAESLYRTILELEPRNADAMLGLEGCHTALQKSKADAERLLAEVMSYFDDFRKQRFEGERLREELREVGGVAKYRTPEESRRLQAAGPKLDLCRTERELLCGKILANLDQAERLDPRNPGIVKARQELALERWREAVAEGDSSRRAALAQEVRELTNDPAVLGELVGIGSLLLTGTPHHADVYLFRSERQDAFRPDGGDGRLVPVPSSGQGDLGGREWSDAFWPGDTCAVVTSVEPGGFAAGSGLSPGDLILSIEGRRVSGGLLVAHVFPGGDAARGGVEPFDQLVAIGEHPCESSYDIDWGVMATRGFFDTRLGLQFARPMAADAGDLAYTLRTRPFRDFAQSVGLALAGPAKVLSCSTPTRSIKLLCLVRGAEQELEMPPGVRLAAEVELTANPLIFSDENLIGQLPRVERELDEGAYLLVLRHEGFDDLRLPVLVKRGESSNLTGALRPRESVPPGFVYIPGDGSTIDDFYIGRHEVTLRDYLDFLNDPQTLEKIRAPQLRLIYVPRSFVDKADGYLTLRDGVYVARGDMEQDSAVVGLSWQDAHDYCEWLSQRAAERNVPWRFTLPTADQWVRAAGGGEPRIYPWGNVFDWSLSKSAFARPEAPTWTEVISRFPTDESLFGVRDMAGNASEYTCTEFDPGLYCLMGGNCCSTVADYFRLSWALSLRSWYAFQTSGFRLCAVPVEK
jgi:hypothetical protein